MLTISRIRKLPNKEIIDLIESKKIDININGKSGNLLYYADFELSKYLIDNNIDTEYVNIRGEKAICYASFFCLNKVKLLIENGAKVDYLNDYKQNIASIVFGLSKKINISNIEPILENLKYLTGKGLNVNQCSVTGISTFYCFMGNEKIVSFLLENGFIANSSKYDILDCISYKEYNSQFLNDDYCSILLKKLISKGEKTELSTDNIYKFALLPKTLKLIMKMTDDEKLERIGDYYLDGNNLHVGFNAERLNGILYLKQVRDNIELGKKEEKKYLQYIELIKRKCLKEKFRTNQIIIDLKNYSTDDDLSYIFPYLYLKLIKQESKEVYAKKKMNMLFGIHNKKNMRVLNKEIGLTPVDVNTQGRNAFFNVYIEDDFFNFLMKKYKSALFQRDALNRTALFKNVSSLYQFKEMERAGLDIYHINAIGEYCLGYQENEDIIKYLIEEKNFEVDKIKSFELSEELLKYLILEKNSNIYKGIINGNFSYNIKIKTAKIILENNIDSSFIKNIFKEDSSEYSYGQASIYYFIEIFKLLKMNGSDLKIINIEHFLDKVIIENFGTDRLSPSFINYIHHNYKKINEIPDIFNIELNNRTFSSNNYYYKKGKASGNLFAFTIKKMIKNYNIDFSYKEIDLLIKNTKYRNVDEKYVSELYEFLIKRNIDKEKKTILSNNGVVDINTSKPKRI